MNQQERNLLAYLEKCVHGNGKVVVATLPAVPDDVREAIEMTIRLVNDAYENADIYTDVISQWLNGLEET
jgi:hypothetical protein